MTREPTPILLRWLALPAIAAALIGCGDKDDDGITAPRAEVTDGGQSGSDGGAFPPDAGFPDPRDAGCGEPMDGGSFPFPDAGIEPIDGGSFPYPDAGTGETPDAGDWPAPDAGDFDRPGASVY